MIAVKVSSLIFLPTTKSWFQGCGESRVFLHFTFWNNPVPSFSDLLCETSTYCIISSQPLRELQGLTLQEDFNFNFCLTRIPKESASPENLTLNNFLYIVANSYIPLACSFIIPLTSVGFTSKASNKWEIIFHSGFPGFYYLVQ